MTSFRSRHRAILALSTLVAAAVLALPTGASAGILTGMESSRELVNTDQTDEQRAVALDKMKAQGVQVVRANFGWAEIAANCSGQTPAQLKNHNNACYDWSRLDGLVRLTKERRQQLLLSLLRNPVWVLNSTDPAFMGRTNSQFNVVVAHYSAFMAAAGARYNVRSSVGFVKYWTILNEPNSDDFWKPAPNAQRYALIYARAAVALKTASPAAQVAPGPTGPNSKIKPVPFIRTFLKFAPRYLPGRTVTLKRKYLNAWAHNPYPGFANQPSVPTRLTNANAIGMANIDRLFVELDKSTLTKGTKVWATEFGWNTSGNFRTSLARQSQFIAESYDWLDSKKRVTIGISYGLTDTALLDDFHAGTYFPNGKAKPSMRMFQRMVSVPMAGLGNKVRRGTVVNVWGRSNLQPRKGILAYKIGKSPWRKVAGQKRAFDGSIRAKMRVTSPTIQFAVFDGTKAFVGDTGYGPSRAFRTF